MDWRNLQKVAALTRERDWLLLRIQQLELERTELLNRLLDQANVKPVPHLAPEVTTKTIKPNQAPEAVLQDLGMGFEDVGDEVANRLRVRWDEMGVAQYDH